MNATLKDPRNRMRRVSILSWQKSMFAPHTGNTSEGHPSQSTSSMPNKVIVPMPFQDPRSFL
ncbi:hypothetical protein CSPX01_09578 [Colletotrichum filicis]|nr:hypothetical protein CSPX01_09578 [Colletotrichum filicis]